MYSKELTLYIYLNLGYEEDKKQQQNSDSNMDDIFTLKVWDLATVSINFICVKSKGSTDVRHRIHLRSSHHSIVGVSMAALAFIHLWIFVLLLFCSAGWKHIFKKHYYFLTSLSLGLLKRRRKQTTSTCCKCGKHEPFFKKSISLCAFLYISPAASLLDDDTVASKSCCRQSSVIT